MASIKTIWKLLKTSIHTHTYHVSFCQQSPVHHTCSVPCFNLFTFNLPYAEDMISWNERWRTVVDATFFSKQRFRHQQPQINSLTGCCFSGLERLLQESDTLGPKVSEEHEHDWPQKRARELAKPSRRWRQVGEMLTETAKHSTGARHKPNRDNSKLCKPNKKKYEY